MFRNFTLIIFYFFYLYSAVANDNSEWLIKNKQGMQLYKDGDLLSAQKAYLEAIDIAEKLELKAEKSATLNNLGLLKIEFIEINEAKVVLNESLRLRLEVYGLRHRYTAQAYNNLARAYEVNDEFETAIDLYIKSMQVYESLGSRYKMLLARTLNNLSTVQIKKGLLDVAEKNLVRSMAISKEYSNDNSVFISAMSNLASIYTSIGRYKAAEQLYFNILNISLRLGNNSGSKLAALYNNIAVVLKKQCKYNEAIEYINMSLNIWRDKKDIDILNYSSTLHNFGELNKALGKYDLALDNFLNSIEILEDNNANYIEQYILQSYSLINLYKQLEELDNANKVLNKINVIRKKNNKNVITIYEIPEGVYEICSSSNI